MKKKFLQNLVASMRKVANSLTEDARSQWDEMVAAVEALEADETEHNITELNDRLAEIEGKYAEQNEQIAERIQKVRNEVMAQLQASTKNVKDQITPEVRKEIANAIDAARRGREDVKNAIMGVLKKNDITGLDFNAAARIAIEFESKPTELFDAFGRTDLDLVYLIGIDETDKDQIAKQWADNPAAAKEVEQLAAEGVALNTKYIYKQQRMANEAIDDARDRGVLAEVEAKTSAELEQQVKRLAEKAAIVGDNINEAGKKVSTFQTIGTATRTTGRIAVVHPAAANPTLLDLAKAADKVDAAVSEKVCVISKEYARDLSAFSYGTGSSVRILSDEDIASQIGVARLVKVDYLNEVEGLHAVILKPSAYKVRVKNELRVAYPKYENNSLYYLYEMNMGGALTELKSAAVLTSAGGSSKGSK